MKHDLKDVTFLILVRIDTIERIENLLACTEFLVSNFETQIEVLEVASYNNGIVKRLLSKRVNYAFAEDDDPILFRTKYLNCMLSSVKTPYVAVWDADVLLEIRQILETMNIIRNNQADCVFPYEKKMLDTSLILRKLYLKKKRIDFLSKNADKMKEMYPPVAVGGAFFCKLDSYIKIGLENEDFYGWGFEDGERYLRWKYSEYKVERVKGVLFHLSHPRGINSLFHNKDQSFIKVRVLESSARKALLSNTK
jgi:hypothetical protein